MSNVKPGLPKPLGKYPRFKTAGNLVFLSGISARLPSGEIDGVQRLGGTAEYDAAAQTRRVLQNVSETLLLAGSSMDLCVDVTMFLVRQEDFAAYNSAYAEFFGENAPARTTVVVRGLPHPDMLVEAKVVATLA